MPDLDLTTNIGYPATVRRMTDHLTNLYEYRDKVVAEATELNRKIEVTCQKIARLEIARDLLQQYVDFVSAPQ